MILRISQGQLRIEWHSPRYVIDKMSHMFRDTNTYDETSWEQKRQTIRRKKVAGKEIVKYKKYKENSFSPFGIKNGIKKWNRISESIEAKYIDEKKRKKEKKG